MENNASVLMQRYELGRVLGQGTFAKVHYARSLISGQAVAIKVIDKEKVLKVGLMDQIKREISVMKMVRHPYIIQLYEVMATKTKIYFVIEYAKGGELFNKIAKGKLKEDVARKYFQQLISAVDFCHSRGVYHRDLKPENLLLDGNDNLKISDFGLSALAESKRQDGLLHTTCGTPAYVAPEVINRKGYDGAKADIWSCGVILFVLLAGYLPFHDSNLMEMYRKIGKAEFKCPNWFPPEVRRLLLKILDPNPNTRISISKIMENSWFRRGFDPKAVRAEIESNENGQVDGDTIFTPNENTNAPAQTKQEVANVAAETKQEVANVAAETKQEIANVANLNAMEIANVANLNAFDIISLSAGFDLSGLFEEKIGNKKETRFTSMQPAETIISSLEKVAKRLRMKIKKKDGGLLKLEGSREGRKGLLAIDAEIFEVTPTFHLVEMKKTGGDTLEYQKVLKRDIRPALKDIVWCWQGDHPQARPEPQAQPQQLEQHLQQPQPQPHPQPQPQQVQVSS